MIFRYSVKCILFFIILNSAVVASERNPFLPYDSNSAISQKLVSPLQDYAMNQLKMSGYVLINNTPWAIVKSPKGYHRITVGENIGQNKGKVIAITPEKITVEEQHATLSETSSKKLIELKIISLTREVNPAWQLKERTTLSPLKKPHSFVPAASRGE